MNEKYADIAALPHKEPRNRVRMPQQNRAAQFAPFADLTGLDGAMAERARLTDSKKEMCEFECAELDCRFRILADALQNGAQPEITVRYFVRDSKKQGGAYVCTAGRLRRIDPVHRKLVFCGTFSVCIDDISEIFVLTENGERDDNFFAP